MELKMTRAIVPGSLADVMNAENLSLAESFMHCDAILLVDTSGSMNMNDAPGGLSRHNAAQGELERLQKSNPGKLGVVSFSSKTRFCPSGIPHRFNEGTDMAGALRFVHPADDCGIRFFLITDGEPDNERKTLEVARTFKSRIDVVFIGAENGRGREFLQRLADVTGGQSVKSAEVGMLGESVERLMLT
jgi:hypothetical protein